MKLELANIREAQKINDLLNVAYRGVEGWTTEEGLVDGDRSVISAVQRSIEHSTFLIYRKKGDLVACICLDFEGQEAHIGSFSVHPDHQAKGLGKSVLNAAERYAVDERGAKKITIEVISIRDELIDFYERRGYQRAGIIQQYPLHLNTGIPKSTSLTIEKLYKNA